MKTLKTRLASLGMAFLVLQGAAFVPNPSGAAEPVQLNTSVTVTGGQILLGDLFSGLDGKADIVVTQAPAPGTTMNIGARDLRRIATLHGLNWAPGNGQLLTRVQRAGRTIPLTTIRQALSESLADGNVNGALDIEFVNRRLNIVVAADQDQSVEIHDMTYDQRTQQFSAWVSAPANDPNAPRTAVKGRVYELIALPVPQNHLHPGEVIQARDIGWRNVRANQATYNTINSLDELVGQSARRPLLAGHLIKRTDVMPRQLVAKGDFVTVHFHSKTMSLTYRGLAMENGAINDVIRISNPRSKKVIEGKVIGPNVATIQLPKFAALN